MTTPPTSSTRVDDETGTLIVRISNLAIEGDFEGAARLIAQREQAARVDELHTVQQVEFDLNAQGKTTNIAEVVEYRLSELQSLPESTGGGASLNKNGDT